MPTTRDINAHRSAILDLLGLAARCPCAAPIEEIWADNVVVETRLHSNDWDFAPMHPLIPADALGSFIAQTWPEYSRVETETGLHSLIAAYCRSHTEQIAEYKFLFASLVMEALKFKWALNVRKLPTKKSGTGIVQKFLRADGKSAFTFDELINMVALDLKLAPKYSFIENRNAIFHTGEAAGAQQGHTSVWPVLRPELVKLHDEVDDLMLSLLRY